MDTIAQAGTIPAVTRSRTHSSIRTGRVLSGIAIAFLLFDSIGKVLQVQAVIDGTAELGYRPEAVLPLGLILLACVAVYAVPRTAFFGAVLLTGYLGGAVATHLRIGNPLLTHTLFPIYVALFVWGGLILRDARLRSLVRQDDGR